jgi:prenyltransferase beta subunit
MNHRRVQGSRTIRWALSVAVTLTFLLSWATWALADASDAVAWLQAQQNADGGFGSPDSAVGATADALLAVAATGENAIGWAKEGQTTLSYLESNLGGVTKAGDTAKVILALVASGVNPRDVGGMDLVAKVEGMVGEDGKIGGENEFINEHCYAMLALASVQRPIPSASADYLLQKQIEDGTWSWNGDTTPGTGDNNTAAMAVIALIAAGVPANNPQIQKTLEHFQAQQNEDGGFPYIKPSPFGTDSDANSTAVVMWAIKAVGQDPAGDAWKYEGQDGHSPLDRIRAFQNESGAFRWQDAAPDDNLAATLQALVALELKTLPFATMDVGTPVATAAAGPEVLPVSGANLWQPVTAIALCGAGLAAIGALLRTWASRRHRA